MKLTEFVLHDAIVPQLQSTDRDGVIRELVGALVAAHAAPATIKDDLIKLVLDREKKGSTGFGKGVAVPHGKHVKVKKMAAAIGVSQKGLDFNALDKAPVYSVILLLSPADKPDEHMSAMEKIFSNLSNDTFRRFLRQSDTVEEIKELIADADAQNLQS